MSRPALWHGGAAGLEPGAILVPPRELAPDRLDRVSRDLDRLGVRVGRRDRVYVTPCFRFAWRWALLRTEGIGRVYQVEPIGALEPDPDYLEVPGFSYQCARARVISVHVLTRQQVRQARKDNQHWQRLYADDRDIGEVERAIAAAVQRGQYADRIGFKVRGR